MPNRIAKESIIESASLASVSAQAERLFWRLVVMADDFGWAPGDPVVVRPRAFPRLIDSVTVADVERWLDELFAGENPLAELWVLDGKPFVHLTGAETHFTRRASKSKHPVEDALDRAHRLTCCSQLHAVASNRKQPQTPANGCKQPPASASRNGIENGIENGNGIEETTAPASPAAPPGPDSVTQASEPAASPKPPPSQPGEDVAPGPPRGDELELTPPTGEHPRKHRGKNGRDRPGSQPEERGAVGRLIGHFVTEFTRLKGAKPTIRGAPEAQAAKTLLRGRSEEEAARIVTKFLEEPPGWCKERGIVNLEQIPAFANAVLASMLAKPTGVKRGRGGMVVGAAREG